ncbi:MAG TPA: peptidoglycan-associated lipoprotein, partial [Azonexus sp.]|nr:peptidoglycan-associated lipoprotein [Azonexus sp.]
MKKLLSISLLLALIAGCSTTPAPDENAGAPVESRSASQQPDVTPVVADGLDAGGLPRVLTDPKSQLSQR